MLQRGSQDGEEEERGRSKIEDTGYSRRSAWAFLIAAVEERECCR